MKNNKVKSNEKKQLIIKKIAVKKPVASQSKCRYSGIRF